MNRNFERALSLVLKHEGGYVDHPKDPGGATNLGVTIGTLSDWLGHPATKAEVKALTVSAVGPIYRRRYWDAIEGDDLPSGLDYAVFDYAVNSGPGRAAKELQRLVGVPADGKIGPVTLAAVKERDPADLIEKLCASRLKFLRGLSTFPTFGKGWTSRVNGVLEHALLMSVSPSPPNADVPTYPEPIPTSGKPEREPSKVPLPVAITIVIIVLAILGMALFFGA